jgi:hypothetical protein
MMGVDPEHPDLVKPGIAVAQRYGLGPGWVQASMFDRVKICGAESWCTKVNDDEAWQWYSVGPPYLLHHTDFKKVAIKWWEFMRPVYAQDRGDIQADMYAYNMAAAHYEVKHVELGNYMVSNEDSDDDEAWKWVDEYEEMSCENPDMSKFKKVPTMLHAAAHYQACTKGDPASNIRGNAQCKVEGSELWNWHKGHVPTQIMQCDQPLLITPPDNLFNVQSDKRGKRRAFMVCIMTQIVNNAITSYKTAHCEPGFNTRKCIRPAMHGGVPDQNPDRFPLARIAVEMPGCALDEYKKPMPP